MIYVSPQAAMSPQLHSHDFLVRLSAAALEAIVFDHLYTVQDAAVLADCESPTFAGQRAGTTEWQAQAGRIVVSLAWDWTEAADGGLHLVRAVAPRTNLQLIDARGYDVDSAPLLFRRIEDIPWHAAVRATLFGAAGRPH